MFNGSSFVRAISLTVRSPITRSAAAEPSSRLNLLVVSFHIM